MINQFVRAEFLRQRQWFFLLLLATVVLFLPIGFTPLWDVDEGAFSEATREMLVSGDWGTTYLNGVLRFDKPILIYWLQALSVRLFGLYAPVVRLPSVLATLLWCASVYLYVLRVSTHKQACWAVFFLLSSVQMAFIGQLAIADALLNALLSTAMLALAYGIRMPGGQLWCVVYAACGLGFLTKGPIALAIPIATMLVYGLLNRSWSAFRSCLNYQPGWVLGAVLVVPWYAYALWMHGWLFVDGFFLHHNVNRALSAMETHSGSWFYYVPIILLGCMPWTPMFCALWRRYSVIVNDPQQCFLVCWCAVVCVVFSCVATKLPHYIVYGYTPLVVLVAQQYKYGPCVRVIYSATAFIMMILLGLPWILPAWLQQRSTQLAVEIGAMQSVISSSFDALFVFWMVLGMLLLAVAAWRFRDEDSAWYIVALLLGWVVHWVWIPRVSLILQDPVYQAAQVAKSQAGLVVMYRVNKPSFSFYRRSITPRRAPHSGETVLTLSRYLSDFRRTDILYAKAGVALARVWW